MNRRVEYRVAVRNDKSGLAGWVGPLDQSEMEEVVGLQKTHGIGPLRTQVREIVSTPWEDWEDWPEEEANG